MKTWQIWKGDVLVCDGLTKRFAQIKLSNEVQRDPKAWGWHIRPQKAVPSPPRYDDIYFKAMEVLDRETFGE